MSLCMSLTTEPQVTGPASFFAAWASTIKAITSKHVSMASKEVKDWQHAARDFLEIVVARDQRVVQKSKFIKPRLFIPVPRKIQGSKRSHR